MAKDLIPPTKFSTIKPTEKEQLIRDGNTLFLSVRSIKNGGAISFRMAYRIDGKQKWITLKERKSLSQARKERDTYLSWLAQGKDPSIERELEDQRTRQQQLAEQEALTKLMARVTVRDLFVRWCNTDLTKRKDVKEIIRMFEKDALPILGGLFVEDVRKGHITQVTDTLKQRDAVHTARNLLKLMRQMFRFAVDRDIIEFEPTASLSVTKTTTKPTERERTLEESEISALARQLPGAGCMKTTECAIWIALSTLCRIGELSKAQWTDVDFEAKIWKIPEANSKNGKAHIVYLSDFALAQFKTLRHYASHDVWLFPNRDGSDHVCEKSITKQIDGRQTSTVLSRRSQNNQALVLSGGKWTPHDLRRTGSTIMGDLNIQPDVIEKCLNHTEENKVKRIYQRQELRAEQAQAWQTLGDRLELLVRNDSNVITFKKSA
jgi:integrase